MQEEHWSIWVVYADNSVYLFADNIEELDIAKRIATQKGIRHYIITHTKHEIVFSQGKGQNK